MPVCPPGSPAPCFVTLWPELVLIPPSAAQQISGSLRTPMLPLNPDSLGTLPGSHLLAGGGEGGRTAKSSGTRTTLLPSGHPLVPQRGSSLTGSTQP